MSLRIALIGDFGGRTDEGMRKLCAQVEAAARAAHEILLVGTRDFASGRAWRRLRAFRPDCLHYLTGPTWRSLAALRAHRSTLPGRPRTIATGIRPYLGPVTRRALPALAPDVYLAQARRWQTLFAAAGARTIDFPSWTDRARFRPADAPARAALRARWGLAADRPVVLHVGHIKENRNLGCLVAAQRSGRYQVLIVGSESESRPGPWRQELEAAGCRVHTQFLPEIEEIYQLADVYAFTVRATAAGLYPRDYDEIGVIDFPLSVLEARSTGLPVVSTRHDALEHFLASDPALRWFDGTGGGCLAALDATGRSPAPPLGPGFDLAELPGRLREIYGMPARSRR
ncbi:MAG TPA: glycosyltransferase [Opitutaceae bacterium]|nr:glycosyltransferase [Opitutaceae bacterium]